MTLEFPSVRAALDHMASTSAEDDRMAKAGHEGLTALERFFEDIHRIALSLEKMQISAARIEAHALHPVREIPTSKPVGSWQEDH